jgi:hypothetical protein
MGRDERSCRRTSWRRRRDEMDAQRVKARGGNPGPSAQTRTRLWTPRTVPERGRGVNPCAPRVRGTDACTSMKESSNRFALRCAGPAVRRSTRAPHATDSASAATAARRARAGGASGSGARHGGWKRRRSRVSRTTAIGNTGFARRTRGDADARRGEAVGWRRLRQERMGRS